MDKYILPTIFILGNMLHIWFLKLNEILKIPDSYAYLQMSHHLKNHSLDGFGNGWFGFLYSMPISFVDSYINNDMLSAFLINILLFNILVGACYIFGRVYLEEKYNYLFLILIFLSPILLNYNINILSENIYIPLFVLLFAGILRYKDIPYISSSIYLSFVLALLYFSRAEAFIYLASIGLIIFYVFLDKQISFSRAVGSYLVVIISFFVFIFPYIFYMHSFTGERGLTNKGSSNLRQAELRGISKMDDDGFEQAVGELTPDNRHLIAGFAGGLKYEKPQNKENLKDYLLKDPYKVFNRVLDNQIKLYGENIPNLIIGNSIKLYEVEGSEFFYKNKLFLIVLMIPLILTIYGIIALIKNGNSYFVYTFFSFFLVGSMFFTLFFVLDRYFVIFVPIFIFFVVYAIEDIKKESLKYFENTKYVLFAIFLIGIYSLGILSYYNTFKEEDEKYLLKKTAGERLVKNDQRKNLKIMERFPVVTYYSKNRERWLTPYTNKLENLIEYAHFNNINYLVVDSIDFKKYRPELEFLLTDSNKDYKGLKKIKEFENNNQKVILYRIE